MHEMVFEKSTATSGVSARVCIKRKSRSCPPLLPCCSPAPSPSDLLLLISYLLSGFSIRDIFPANSGGGGGRADRRARFALSILRQLFFTRGSFFPPVLSRLLGYVPRRANFERPYNAYVLRASRASQCRITSAYTSFPVTRGSPCQLIWQAICGWNRIRDSSQWRMK